MPKSKPATLDTLSKQVAKLEASVKQLVDAQNPTQQYTGGTENQNPMASFGVNYAQPGMGMHGVGMDGMGGQPMMGMHGVGMDGMGGQPMMGMQPAGYAMGGKNENNETTNTSIGNAQPMMGGGKNISHKIPLFNNSYSDF